MTDLRKPLEEIEGRQNSVVAIGRTRAGRYLRVVYVTDCDGAGFFVITAYDHSSTQLRAFNRRLRRRQQR